MPSATLQLTCEFCTMTFSTIQTMFQHIRTAHTDRLSSPNAYTDHLNRIANYENHTAKLDSQNRQLPISSEQNSPRSDMDIGPTGTQFNITDIKQEMQENPTDLSKRSDRDTDTKSTAEVVDSSVTDLSNLMCNQCNAVLADFESFRNHLKDHLNQSVSNSLCQHCGMSFSNQVDYERHVISHFLIVNTEYFCNLNCNQSFVKPDELQKHLLEMHSQTLYKCGICAELFDTKVAIQVHFAVSHLNEIKVYRCSACLELFKNEVEFRQHVKTVHTVTGTVQCLFCRTICSSELEMHFHLAAHARQFRCPACSETFHVEFLLDRHMQIHHTQKDQSYQSNKSIVANTINNNNNIDYPYASSNNNFYGFGSKPYNGQHCETPSTAITNNWNGFYDVKSRFELMKSKNFTSSYGLNASPALFSPTATPSATSYTPSMPNSRNTCKEVINIGLNDNKEQEKGNFLCGICEKNDFTTEAEVHSHRKISHNLKTGVSLRCAYCNDNFRSRYVLLPICIYI